MGLSSKEKSKRYYDSPHGKAARKLYSQSEAHKRAQKIVNTRQYQTETSTPEGRAGILWRAAKQRAGLKNLPFTITKQFLIEKLTTIHTCEVTGASFDYSLRHDVQQNPYMPSLDQRVPGEGYTPENVQVVISWYNRFKGDLSDSEALRILDSWKER